MPTTIASMTSGSCGRLFSTTSRWLLASARRRSPRFILLETVFGRSRKLIYHDSYPRAIRTELGTRVRHRTSQAKRKANDLPVSNHLMPVILGPQGNGKSTLVRHLLAPIDELTVDTDFAAITDERIISIWQSYVGFLGEMKGPGNRTSMRS